MMVVQHNLQAMNAARQLNIVGTKKQKSTEKLSSGYRINRAADDAAGLSISEKMRKKIRALNRGQDNTQDGISFIQVADGAMSEVGDMIHRMSVLAIQAANGTNSDSDREALQQEVSSLKKEIDRVNDTTQFNEMNVFVPDPPLQPQVQFYVSGTPDWHNDLSFFTDDKGNYGGIVFHGNRVAWSDIDSQMYDATTNTFKGGTYTWTAPAAYQESYPNGKEFPNGKTGTFTLTFTCQDGSTPPAIDRTLNISTDDKKGFIIDGEEFGWKSEFVKFNGLIDDVANWEINYHGIKLQLDFIDCGTDADSMKKALEYSGTQTMEYRLHEIPTGSQPEKILQHLTAGGTFVLENPDNKAAEANHYYPDLEANKPLIQTVSASSAPSSESVQKYGWNYIQTIAKDSSIDPDEIPAYIGEDDNGGTIDEWDKGQDITAHSDSSAKSHYYYYRDPNDYFTMKFQVSDDVGSADMVRALNQIQYSTTYSNQYTAALSGSPTKPDFNTVASVTMDNGKNFVSPKAEAELGKDFEAEGDTTLMTGVGSGLGTLNFGTYSKDNGYPLSLQADTTAALQSIVDSQVQHMRYLADQKIINEFADQWFSGDAKTRFLTEKGTQTDQTTAEINLDFKTKDGSDGITVKGTRLTERAINYMYDISWKFEFGLLHLNNGNGKYIQDPDDSSKYIDEEEFNVRKTKYYQDAYNAARSSGSSEDEAKTAGENVVRNKGYEKAFSDRWKYSIYLKIRDIANSKEPTCFYDSAEDLKNDTDGQFEKFAEAFTHRDRNGSPQSGGPTAIGSAESCLEGFVEDLSVDLISKQRTTITHTLVTPSTATLNRKTLSAKLVKTPRLEKDATEWFGIQHSDALGDRTLLGRFNNTTRGLGLLAVNLTTEDTATKSIDLANDALAQLSRRRSQYGAWQNALEHTFNSRANMEENTQAAETRIRDTDMAEEAENYSKNNILAQAGQSVLAQANQSNQGVLSLLQ